PYRTLAGDLVRGRLDVLGRAAERHRQAQEQPREVGIATDRRVADHLAVGEAGKSERIAQAAAAHHLGIRVELEPGKKAHAGIQRVGVRYLVLGIRAEAVRTLVWAME